MALHSVSESKNVRFDEGTYDLRNFEVRGRSDKDRIGTVHDVLVDDNGRARYVCIRHDNDKHTLIPAGQTRADQRNRRLMVPGMTSESFRDVPEYSHDPAVIDANYERKLSSSYSGAYSDETFHERPEYRGSGFTRGTTGTASGKLGRLDQLSDYKVADGDIDPRGWKVIARDGSELGEVDHLIADTGNMRVRYLAVKIDRNIDKNRRTVLIPTGHVNLDDRRNRVVAGGLDRNCIAAIPEYKGGQITRDEERRIATACEQPYAAPERQYAHPRYRDEHLWDEEARISRSEEELKVGTHERKAGEVDVKKHVETEHVRKPVTLHREEVEVERRPASGDTTGAEMRDREIRVPVTEEEVVVEKRPRVVEEIVVRKRDVEETAMVEEDVRKERVDIDERRDERR